MAEKEKYGEIFKILEGNVNNFLEQMNIPESEEKRITDFEKDKYWANLIKIGDKLGFESNKITIMWTNDPPPSAKDMHAVCAALELACVALLNCHHSFPSSQGRTIKTILESSIKLILQSVVKFVSVLTQSVGHKYSKENHPLIAECGALMSHCDSLKQMPSDNETAVAAKLLDNANLIKDALRELEEAKNSDSFMEDFECEDTWSDNDLQFMNPLLGLIKTSGALNKKTQLAVKNYKKEDKTKLDSLPTLFSRFPELVDDLALSLYPPVDWELSKKEAWKLKELLEDVILNLEAIFGEEEQSWIKFVDKAVKHNIAEIHRIYIQHGMASLQLTDSPPANQDSA